MSPRPRATQKEQGNALFLGSSYSNQELAFLLEHFGESPEVAIPEEEDLPPGVNEAAVRPILDHTYRLHTLAEDVERRHPGEGQRVWCGFDALRRVCEATLEWNTTVRELRRRTEGAAPEIRRAAGAPSLHMWDPDTDIPYLGGIGADADVVRTALNADGQRIPLFVVLRETGVGAIKDAAGVAEMIRGGTKTRKSLIANTPNALEYEAGEVSAVVRCPVCGHTEVYETNKPSTKRAAERRMAKHLSSAKVKKDQHHLLAQRINSGRAGTAPRRDADEADEPTGEAVGAGV